MEFKYHTVYGIYLTTFALPFVIGQTLTGETLKNMSFCDPNNVSISCSSNSIIALENVQLGYNDSRCNHSCCSLDTDDCIVNSTDIEAVKRTCSGYSACSPSLLSYVQFCDFGQQNASYLYFEYFCIPDCGKPTNPDNGNITLNAAGTTYGASANVTCVEGYQSNKDTIFCQSSGNWQATNCTIKDCGQPTNPDNGNITLNAAGTKYEASAKVICVDGYQSNKDTIFCQASGNWQIANCTIKDCGQPTHPDNGNITLNATGTTYGASANVTCVDGYQSNTDTIFCQASGNWQAANCTIKDCGYPTIIENGYITLQRTNATTYGSSANVWCTTDYQSNTKTILCLASGEWEAAMCIVIDKNQKGESIIIGIIGAVTGIAATVVVGAMVFLIQNIYRKRKESTTRTVASPDTSNADAVPNYQQLEPISTIGDVHQYQQLSADAVRNYEQLQPATMTDESDHYHELASVTGTGRF